MFQVAYRTDVGLRRSTNQDTVRVCEDLKLCIVADGMGGYKGGEIASLLAADAIEQTIRDNDHGDMRELLKRAIINANRTIYLKACDEPDLKGMGTTVSLVYLDENQIHIAHVGDSRVYFINDGIKQMTMDHTLVENLIARGEIDRSQAKVHPKRNVITRAVGSDPDVDIDYAVYNSEETQKVLICSDGLTGRIDDQEIFEIVDTNTVEKAVDALIQLANDRGGSDNISVVIIEI